MATNKKGRKMQPNKTSLLAASVSLAEAAEKKAEAKAYKAEAARDKILARHARFVAKRSALLARVVRSGWTSELSSALSVLGAASGDLWGQRHVANAVRYVANEQWAKEQSALTAARRAYNEAVATAKAGGDVPLPSGAVI
jgi:hypothetical protein